MSYDLNTLFRERDNLLLAEVAAWVHDWQKCIDMKAASNWDKNPHVDHAKIDEWRQRGKTLKPREFANVLEKLVLNLCGLKDNIEEIAVQGQKPDLARRSPNYLIQVLGQSHDVGHVEKELGDHESEDQATDRISSPFGWEPLEPDGLLEQLLKEPKTLLENFSPIARKNVLTSLQSVFTQAWGDTRRPINEVTLWDWSSIVAALYKAELARCVLTNQQRNPSDISWRLLSIRVDGLQYLLSVSRIPDVLARRELLTDAWNRMQTLIEETYPLGLEVYRDENGSVFVVPDIENLLDKTQVNTKTLRILIQEEFAAGTVKNNPCLAMKGERVPELYLDDKAWKGQPAPQELPPIANHLKRDLCATTDPSWLKTLWQNQNAEVCTVCGLRPQGPNPKAWERKVCDVCEQRRANRSETWANKQLGRTIWTDEVADTNARLALITGTFDLEHWLDGSLLQSLLLIAPHDPQNKNGQPVTPKTPSFSRLRRIWKTTQSFWQEVQQELLSQLVDDRRRLRIYLDQPANLAGFHVYDLMLGTTDLSVVWIPPQSNVDGYLLSADNLGTIARRLGAEQAVYNHPATAAIFVEDYINDNFIKKGRTPSLYNPENTGNKANLLNGFQIRIIQYQQNAYATTIPLLAEPRVFMALVPADQALEIIRQIKTKYEREMGKVRNRLPLHLGVVFAPRPTPLRAVLDAGRAMLERQTVAGVWKVLCCARKMVSKDDSLPPRFQPDRAGQFAEWYEVTLQRDDQRLTWYIPASMGDGQTEDLWYPYVFLDDPVEPTTRKRYFKSRNPWKGCDGWLVHAAELQVGDQVWFAPATFDFEFLDTTTRRFEIHYDTNGRRSNRRTRPFYLDDLERFDRLWEVFLRLSTTQRHQVVRTIEATREEWFGQDRNGESVPDPVFRQFVHNTLADAEWDWRVLPQHIRDQFVAAGVRGELADLLELRMEILKEE